LVRDIEAVTPKPRDEALEVSGIACKLLIQFGSRNDFALRYASFDLPLLIRRNCQRKQQRHLFIFVMWLYRAEH